MKKILLLLTLLISGLCSSQTVNDYKYLVVPVKFDFFKEENKYNLNMLTKMMFEKYGFTVYQAGQKMPDEVALDKCKALYGTLESDSGVLTTALYITIKDCDGKELFRSTKGVSKIKDFKQAYYEALREAAVSLESLNYQYSGKDAAAIANEVRTAPKQTAPATSISSPETIAPEKPIQVSNENQLFAQPIANGYQLVDMTPKVVLKMYKTSQPDNFTAQGEGKNGVVFKKGNEWFFEYYQNEKLVSEKLNIKF
ncbi:hypothetical protein HYN59_01280 [Flavobacterium album]|uniref:DUF4468 domain-containing protein n=1 Tax=Flavobacterium album TaxID=2175091 RepID=A0A2S1QTR4_9FLAO|nr:hypothetical protein [Flavobacterium album]AWH83830.1 hypothetical protein HYN59_01280 [Flavobacterium album]